MVGLGPGGAGVGGFIGVRSAGVGLDVGAGVGGIVIDCATGVGIAGDTDIVVGTGVGLALGACI